MTSKFLLVTKYCTKIVWKHLNRSNCELDGLVTYANFKRERACSNGNELTQAVAKPGLMFKKLLLCV